MPVPGIISKLGGAAFALEVAMTGRFFNAEELERAGVLTKVVDDGQHLSAAEELARQILENPQRAVRELVRYRRALASESAQQAQRNQGQV